MTLDFETCRPAGETPWAITLRVLLKSRINRNVATGVNGDGALPCFQARLINGDRVLSGGQSQGGGRAPHELAIHDDVGAVGR